MSAVTEATSNAAAKLETRRVGTHLGAEVSGVTLAETPGDDTVAAIGEALAEHEVLVFRDQPMSAEQVMAFGRRFGDLTVHPFSPSRSAAPELIVFNNDADNPPFGTDCWHSDETFREAPPLGTILHALDVPELGGDTMFASMTAAYEGLSDRVQQHISGLEAVHDMRLFRTLFADDEDGRAALHRFEGRYPQVRHPVVREHPVTGKKVLFVNPQFTIGIHGMDEHESRSLLGLLYHQAQIPEYQYRHHWRNATLVFWDNRSTQHYAVHDYFPQVRRLQRVTIKGDRPRGAAGSTGTATRKKPHDPAAKDRFGGHRPLDV